MVKDAVITFGVIIEFTIYVRLFTQPLQQLAQSFSSMQSTAAAADRVFEYLDEEELSDESGKSRRLDSVKGHVRFDHVRFGYNPDKIIIKDFSSELHPVNEVNTKGQ